MGSRRVSAPRLSRLSPSRGPRRVAHQPSVVGLRGLGSGVCGLCSQPTPVACLEPPQEAGVVSSVPSPSRSISAPGLPGAQLPRGSSHRQRASERGTSDRRAPFTGAGEGRGRVIIKEETLGKGDLCKTEGGVGGGGALVFIFIYLCILFFCFSLP